MICCTGKLAGTIQTTESYRARMARRSKKKTKKNKKKIYFNIETTKLRIGCNSKHDKSVK
jgi:hypothetical protein